MTRSSDQLVGVAGATGFVGRHVTRHLLERGHRVRVLVRDAHKADEALPGLDVQRVYAEVLDEEAARRLLDGAGACVNCIGIRREIAGRANFRDAHVTSVRRLVDGARAAGARRFVHVSALGVRDGAPTPYQRSKFEGEMIVRASHLEWTIFRPSLIHGPDSELVAMIRDWVLGRAAPRGFLPYFARIRRPEQRLAPPRLESARLQPVHVDDVAGAIADALDNPRSIGEVYPLTGPDTYTWPELLTLVRDAMPLTDRRKKPRAIPGPLALCMAHGARALGLAEALPFGTSEPVMAMEDSTAPRDKAGAHLSFSPRPFEESLLAYAPEI